MRDVLHSDTVRPARRSSLEFNGLVAYALGYPEFDEAKYPKHVGKECIDKDWDDWCDECHEFAARLDRARHTRHNDTGHLEPPIHLKPPDVHRVLDAWDKFLRAAYAAKRWQAKGEVYMSLTEGEIARGLMDAFDDLDDALGFEVMASRAVRDGTHSPRPRRTGRTDEGCRTGE